MRVTEKLVAASLLALMAGCSSWNPFASKDPKVEPAKLVELKSSIAVRDVWKYSIGKAGVYAFTPALAGSSLYVAIARAHSVEVLDQFVQLAGSFLQPLGGCPGTLNIFAVLHY